MKIIFKWNNLKPQDSDLTTIEENIFNEISHLLLSKPESSESLSIDLNIDPLGRSLVGCGRTASKPVVVTFTYLLEGHHLASYQYHQ